MDRRTVLGGSVTVLGSALAGCLGGDAGDGDGGGEENEEGGTDRGTENLDDETVALAEALAAAIDEELTLVDWRFHGSLYIPQFADGQGPQADIPILGVVYADAVEAGFDHLTMPTALDEEGTIDYMVYIDPEWAAEFIAGVRSEQEYHDAIEETIH